MKGGSLPDSDSDLRRKLVEEVEASGFGFGIFLEVATALTDLKIYFELSELGRESLMEFVLYVPDNVCS